MYHKHTITQGLTVSVLAVALSFSMQSCIKGDREMQENLATVTFSIPGMSSGAMPTTKATTDDIQAALLATRPTGTPSLTIASSENSSQTYSAKVGTPVSIPYGRYVVTANYLPDSEGIGLGGSLHKTPSYAIEQTVEITEATTGITLEAKYTSFAIILDTDECAKYQHSYINNTYVDIPAWAEVGNIKLIYVKPNPIIETSKPYKIKAFPKDTENYSTREYSLITSEQEGYIKVATGKWYRFSPKSSSAQIGDIGIGFPEWEQGETS